MGRPRLLVAMIVVTVACAVVAAVIPAGAYASHIELARSIGVYDGSFQKVQVDGREVVIHVPSGFVIKGSGESHQPARVDVTMVSRTGYSGILVSIEAGPGPRAGRKIGERDGRPIYVVQRGRGITWELLPGATLVVESRNASEGQQLDLIRSIET